VRPLRAACVGAVLGAAQCLGGTAAVAQALGPVATQSVSQVVTVDRESLFTDSQFGKRVQAQLEQERARLAAETRKIETDLQREEQALTAQRDSLTPEAFRTLANAFDAKVQDLRQQSAATEQDFLRRMEREQLAFFDLVGPILGQLVRELGAIVILDRRVIVLTTRNIDITDLAIARIDEVLGRGDEGPTESTPAAPPVVPMPAQPVPSDQ